MHENAAWDVRYEWRAILILTIGFGLVGLDRFAINPLFPAMMKDLNLDYQDLGNISAFLAVAWGLSCICMGQVSDRIGRRKVLIPAVIAFSAMAGFTGLVTGIGSLIAARVVMGLAEGAFLPAGGAATLEASKPSRRGLNYGILGTGLPLIGLGLGPIIATQLLHATGSWRIVFAIVALPGFVLAYFMYKVLRDTQGTGATAQTMPSEVRPSWREALRHHNVRLGCLIMICAAGALNVVIAMTPSYLVEHLGYETQRMGFILSGTGLGALIGSVALPALSDRWGRKTVLLISGIAATLMLWIFMTTSAGATQLFLLLTAIALFGFAVITINAGPLIFESVPAAIASTAIGIVSGAGEILGSAVTPVLAGFVAKNYGIQHVFGVALGAMIACVICILLLRDPRGVAKPVARHDVPEPVS